MEKYPFKTKVEKRWSDLDEFGVVNNAVFMTYFEQARVNLFADFVGWNWKTTGVVVANVNMNFRTPIRMTDNPTIYIRCSKIGTTSYSLECLMSEERNDKEIIFAEAIFVMVCFDFKTGNPVAIPEIVKSYLEKLL
jgi:acyl-CoA thioester hydrolase